MNQVGVPAVLVEDSTRLRLYPDISAILAGGAPLQLGTVIPDDFVQSYSLNTTIGTAWQLGRAASLDVDYVHAYADHQTGFSDRNTPSSGTISATNPRPVREFAQVWMLENFTRSWYDALEMQLRVNMPRSGRLQASYTLSRSYLDGVDFFNTVRGTQRTPRERGYSPSDQRHNLTAAASFPLPWRLEVSAIVKLISGSPMPVQAGMDLDGDRSPTGDRPPGLAITVGRDNVEESLRIINEFRAGLTLPPVDSDLLRLDPYRSFDVRLSKSVPGSRPATARTDAGGVQPDKPRELQLHVRQPQSELTRIPRAPECAGCEADSMGDSILFLTFLTARSISRCTQVEVRGLMVQIDSPDVDKDVIPPEQFHRAASEGRPRLCRGD